MAKIIDFVARKQQQEVKINSNSKGLAEIIDIVQPRTEMLNEERRELKRTILSEFVGAFVVVPERGLLRVSLYDISEDGLAFEVEQNQGAFGRDEKVAMRIYLNHKTYFEFVVQIKWSELNDDIGVLKQGGRFVKNTVNEVALSHFVKFIEAVSVNLRADHGDLQISSGS